MATHDRYDNDILKQLTRIANGLGDLNKHIDNATFALNMLIDSSRKCILDCTKEHPEWSEKNKKLTNEKVD